MYENAVYIPLKLNIKDIQTELMLDISKYTNFFDKIHAQKCN